MYTVPMQWHVWFGKEERMFLARWTSGCLPRLWTAFTTKTHSTSSCTLWAPCGCNALGCWKRDLLVGCFDSPPSIGFLSHRKIATEATSCLSVLQFKACVCGETVPLATFLLWHTVRKLNWQNESVELDQSVVKAHLRYLAKILVKPVNALVGKGRPQ